MADKKYRFETLQVQDRKIPIPQQMQEQSPSTLPHLSFSITPSTQQTASVSVTQAISTADLPTLHRAFLKKGSQFLKAVRRLSA